MGKCGIFGSHRFKDYGTNAPTDECVRCGKVHADVARARGVRADPLVGWPWPVGTEYAVKIEGGWLSGWFITQYTPKTVWLYRPEYDGENKRARRAPIDQFAADIANGIVKRL